MKETLTGLCILWQMSEIDGFPLCDPVQMKSKNSALIRREVLEVNICVIKGWQWEISINIFSCFSGISVGKTWIGTHNNTGPSLTWDFLLTCICTGLHSSYWHIFNHCAYLDVKVCIIMMAYHDYWRKALFRQPPHQ